MQLRSVEFSDWAAGIVRQYASLGMPSPFLSPEIVTWVSKQTWTVSIAKLEWSACVPKDGSIQRGQVVRVLCMVLLPGPIAF